MARAYPLKSLRTRRNQMKSRRSILALLLAGAMGFAMTNGAVAQSHNRSYDNTSSSSERDRDRERGRDSYQERNRDQLPDSDSDNRSQTVRDNQNRVLRVNEVPERETPMGRRATGDALNAGEELDFQTFVNRNYGKWLPIYGRDAFSSIDQGFDAPVNSTPSDLYEMGPGDEVRIKITGYMEMDANLVVDNTGFITLPRVGPILVSGVLRRDLQAVIDRALSRVYKNYTLHVYTGTLRTISVFVVGHAGRPGSYRVPATSSLLNALYAAGGVSSTGSLRTVKLMRSGKQVSVFDFYDFVSKGLTAGDVPLRNGDVIHVPAAGPRVALIGASNVQAIFEISLDSSLVSLLEVAGGLPSASRYENITVDRLDKQHPQSPKQVIVLDLSKGDEKFALRDGDVVTLNSVGSRYANMVSVRGSVYQPIRRNHEPGMRVSTLIPGIDMLYSPETVRSQNDLALGVQNIDRRQRDRRTAGDDRNGIDVRRSEGLIAADNINWNLAAIERKNARTGQTEILHFNLGRAIREPGGPEDLQLQPGDQVVVYGDRNLTLPEELRNRFVRVEGEVRAAGIYQLRDGETLKQLIERAGGVTSRSFIYGLRLRRQVQAEIQREQLAKAASLIDDAISSQMNAAFASGLTTEEKAINDSMIVEMRRRSESLQRLRPDGRIALDIPFGATVDDLPDVLMEDGDVLLVPLRSQQVTVAGAVQNPLTTLWSPGESFDDYVNNAVPKKTADLSEIYVIRANGRAEVIRRGSLFSSGSNASPQPGDTVYVPEKPVGLSHSAAWFRGLRDWSTVIFQMVLGASVAKNF